MSLSEEDLKELHRLEACATGPSEQDLKLDRIEQKIDFFIKEFDRKFAILEKMLERNSRVCDFCRGKGLEEHCKCPTKRQ